MDKKNSTLYSATAALLAVPILAVMVFFGSGAADPPPDCGGMATVADGTTAGTGTAVTPAQRAQAATIVAATKARSMSQRAAVIALSTAYQESHLANLANPNVPASMAYPHEGTGTDHDSVGTFQQRPSMGWGTVAQLMTPSYAADKFLATLAGVPGWATMPVWQAAQKVQGSADGTLYAKWESLATSLAASLWGGAPVAALPPAGGGTTATNVAATTAAAAGVAWPPPPLNHPITLTVPDSGTLTHLPRDQDYLLKIPGTIHGTLHIDGGHNVVLIGGAVDAGTSRNAYLQNQTGTIHIEGVDFVSTSAGEGFNLSESQTTTVQLENIRIARVNGSYSTNHADLIQSWAGPGTLRVDRFEGWTTYQGLFILPGQHTTSTGPWNFDLRHMVTRDAGGSKYHYWFSSSPNFHLSTQSVVAVKPGSSVAQTIWNYRDKIQLVGSAPSPLTGNPGPNYLGASYTGGGVTCAVDAGFDVNGPLPPPNTAAAATAIAYARAQLGKPYVWGGTGPVGYDCSGLVYMAFKSAGITLPRTAEYQIDVGVSVPKDQLQPGDLVFFNLGEQIAGRPGHVGIYLGNGMMIDAPHTGAFIRIEKVDTFGVYIGARRVTGTPA